MICKNCGKEISKMSKYCGYCGAKVNENPTFEEVNIHATELSTDKYLSKKDYSGLLGLLRNPFQVQKISFVAALIIVVGFVVINMILVRSTIDGVLISLLFCAGLYTFSYLNSHVGLSPSELTIQVGSLLFVPSLLLLVAAVFIRIGVITTLWLWPILISMIVCLGSIITQSNKINRYIIVAVISLLYAVLITVILNNDFVVIFSSILDTLQINTVW